MGRVRFTVHDDGRLDAIHEVYTTFTDPDQPAVVDPKPEAFLVQVAPLGPASAQDPSNANREGGMAEKKKDGGQTPERAKPKPGHETVAAPFDDIIDAILEADPDAVREHKRKRRERKARP